MRLTRTVILTDDIQQLAGFYERLLREPPEWYRDHYAEFTTGSAVLALFTVAGHEAHVASDAAAAGANRSMKVEFEVDDVGAVFARLRADGHRYDWVLQPPKDLPWDTRSVVLRDPAGHLIELYAQQ